MAVAEEDAGVTLVSFSNNTAARRVLNTAAKPPGHRNRPHTGRRSLSRLLGRCAVNQEEDEQQVAQRQQRQQRHSVEEVNHPQLSGIPADLPDSPQHDTDKIKLVGFKRSHSFCLQPKKSNKNYGCRSSSSTRAEREGSRQCSYECQTLKTSREVKMERERVRRARGETLWADKDDVFSSFMRQNQERFNTLLEERGFTHIPPPAGFGAPTRPSSLLTALACGPTSLDDGELSGAAGRRATYTIRRSATAGFQTTNDGNKENESEESSGPADAEYSPPESTVKEEEDDDEEEEPWCDLPSSPLSPPSPFHHPFFRHQLGLPTPVADPWARFSGFGMPRLPQVLLAHAQAQQEAAAKRNEEWNKGGGRPREQKPTEDHVERRRHSTNDNRGASLGGGQYCVSSRHSVVRYCTDASAYNVSRLLQGLTIVDSFPMFLCNMGEENMLSLNQVNVSVERPASHSSGQGYHTTTVTSITISHYQHHTTTVTNITPPLPLALHQQRHLHRHHLPASQLLTISHPHHSSPSPLLTLTTPHPHHSSPSPSPLLTLTTPHHRRQVAALVSGPISLNQCLSK
ncbi:hypothetical protein Hamer_G009140 [Homarus americanus]|uniref:Uncharacterized protein n=1 Tax=Homarus americanus TaxID=6706 RepID=A0A8J5N9A0_HOMAM|nr:hypothetical protein Hamer_G009140 [Homarus americanus]